MINVIATIVLAHAGMQAAYHPTGPQIKFTMSSGKSFVITTDPTASPKTVAHIVKLVRSGFYDRQRIHRVENWVTQWGAPASKTEPLMVGKGAKRELNEKVGDGGSGANLPFEGSQTIDFVRGIAGIASEGLQQGGDSQIFVLKKDAIRLFNSYAVLGKVTEGMATVDGIKFGDRIARATILGGHPIRKKR